MVDATEKQESQKDATPSLQTKPRFRLNVCPSDKEIDEQLVETIRSLEAELKMPVLLFIQDGDEECEAWDTVGHDVYEGFRKSLSDLKNGTPVALVIESAGGYAESAYKIATLLRRHCGEFTAVIPARAKSAATLLALGAKEIILHRFAEIGPLDAQVFDHEREQYMSALDEVQTLERLNSAAMAAVDAQMILWLSRTGKRTDKLLPQVFSFVSHLLTPLYEKIDTVHYTRTARVLKVGQEYAWRLLESYHGKRKAEVIADKLTTNYPDHGFVIDIDECQRIGLRVQEAQSALETGLDRLMDFAKGRTLLGRAVETL